MITKKTGLSARVRECLPPSVMAGKKNQRKNQKKFQKKGTVSGTVASPIPHKYPATLAYYGIGTINAASGLTGSTGYRLNGMFDPDYSGAGIQPTYYDQMSALYSKYRVYRASVVVELSNETEETTSVFVTPSIANSALSSLAAMCTQRFATTVTLGPKSGGFGIKRISRTFDIAKVWGVDQRTLHSEDDFAALTSGNPNNVVYLWLGGRTIGSTATIIRYTVRIRFHCDFHMPVIMDAS